jgi:Protein of unknown function (DUF2635)
MKVVTAPGRAVRHPVSGALVPPEGMEVNELDLYWARRLRDGDVVEATDPPPDPPPETQKQEA